VASNNKEGKTTKGRRISKALLTQLRLVGRKLPGDCWFGKGR